MENPFCVAEPTVSVTNWGILCKLMFNASWGAFFVRENRVEEHYHIFVVEQSHYWTRTIESEQQDYCTMHFASRKLILLPKFSVKAISILENSKLNLTTEVKEIIKVAFSSSGFKSRIETKIDINYL